jgi:uncharacterized membrane protein YbhN (UPF0104 family)
LIVQSFVQWRGKERVSVRMTERSGARAGWTRVLRIVQAVVSVAVVAAIFAYVLPKISDYSSVWSTIRALTWAELSTLILATLLNLCTYYPQMVASMPGLTLARAAINNQSTTSIANTMPGGGALAVGVSYAMYRSWGFSNSEIALSTMVTGIWNSFLKLALPIVSLAVLAIEGTATMALLVPAVIGVAILILAVCCFGLLLWKKALARRIGTTLGSWVSSLRKMVRKPPVGDWGEAAVQFRSKTITLLARRWLPLTLFTILSHLALYFVLLLALRHVGVSEGEVSSAQVLAVFAFARLLGTVPITPGAVGLIELALIAGIVLAGQGDAAVAAEPFRAQVVAAVLLFRALTYGVQIPIGALTYLLWRRSAGRLQRAGHHQPESAGTLEGIRR